MTLSRTKLLLGLAIAGGGAACLVGAFALTGGMDNLSTTDEASADRAPNERLVSTAGPIWREGQFPVSAPAAETPAAPQTIFGSTSAFVFATPRQDVAGEAPTPERTPDDDGQRERRRGWGGRGGPDGMGDDLMLPGNPDEADEEDRSDRRDGRFRERGDRLGEGRDAENDEERRRRWREQRRQEWEQIATFMEENSPRRFAIFREMVDRIRAARDNNDGGWQDWGLIRDFRDRIVKRYHMIERMRERSPALYEFQLKQLRLEDDVVGGLLDLRETQDEKTAAEINARLDALTRDYVINLLEERQRRIEWLRDNLAKEEKRLAEDFQQIDKLRSDLRQRIERQLPDASLLGEPPQSDEQDAPATQPAPME